MVLERLYVIPHGDEIIDVPNQESRELRDKITEVTRGDSSDSIIVLTPHGMMNIRQCLYARNLC